MILEGIPPTVVFAANIALRTVRLVMSSLMSSSVRRASEPPVTLRAHEPDRMPMVRIDVAWTGRSVSDYRGSTTANTFKVSLRSKTLETTGFTALEPFTMRG